MWVKGLMKLRNTEGNIMVQVSFLDYGAGNVRSVRNSIQQLGHTIKDIECPEDIREAEIIVFPGVGSFGKAMENLRAKNYEQELKEYLQKGKAYFGICLGMQTLFEESQESEGVKGLGIINGKITKFDAEHIRVPHIGWNGLVFQKELECFQDFKDTTDLFYFVHSYHATLEGTGREWVLTTTTYGSRFVSSVQKGNIIATQFHPEKSGSLGLSLLGAFLERQGQIQGERIINPLKETATVLSKRIIACLDVRNNDQGDLVVTKGDQYDVRESRNGNEKGHVRNLGKPVALATRYYNEGADEITFLNITSFRENVISDLPLLEVLKKSSEEIFVPLTIGGGIRDYTDSEGNTWSALHVASEYFRAGADKISIGSDAVYAAEEYIKTGVKTGQTSIETISQVYGVQAVVVSIDPRRVYISDESEASGKHIIRLDRPHQDGKSLCWYQATVKGGREGRDLDAVALAKACEELGAGEILLNCVDMDGQKNGYDLKLIDSVCSAVSIPVIASSGAGSVEHFHDVFRETAASAALAAGIFHRKEVEIQDVKNHLCSIGSFMVRTSGRTDEAKEI